ncbi:MAG TPA: hypothetical protein VL527_18090 [Dongiaceae bacterium]|nr:hypothetical protein [Dongiaceae bacterium]
MATLPSLFLLLGSGCGGINASQSVSPASFFLPGLMQADPPAAAPTAPLPDAAPAHLLAQTQ